MNCSPRKVFLLLAIFRHTLAIKVQIYHFASAHPSVLTIPENEFQAKFVTRSVTEQKKRQKKKPTKVKTKILKS